MAIIKAELKNKSSKLTVDSNSFLKLPLPSYVSNILDNITYSNNNLNFTKSEFNIYPFENEKEKSLELSFIKDFSQQKLPTIENSIFSQIGNKFNTISNYSYILIKDSVFIDSNFFKNIEYDKYQGIKVNYSPQKINNLNLRLFYGIKNDEDINNFIDGTKELLYGLTYKNKINNFGNIFLYYQKYSDFNNYFFSYSSSNLFLILDYFENDDDYHYSTFAETVIYKSNKKECVLNNQNFAALLGISYYKDYSKILPSLSIYSSKISKRRLNIFIDKNRKINFAIKTDLSIGSSTSLNESSNNSNTYSDSIKIFNCTNEN